MRYLLDTNHWSYIQEKRPVVLARLRQLPPEPRFFMSVATQAELLGGIELLEEGRRRLELVGLYRESVGMARRVLGINSRIAEEFARIMASLRRAGRPIETNDMWIAATARVYDLTVASSDAHFRFVPGLRVEDWTQPADGTP